MNWFVQKFHLIVLTRTWLTFVVLFASFGLFGAGTFNLFNMFSSNWDMITKQGLMAFVSSPALQLLDLLLTLMISMFFYVIFKICEHSLVNRFIQSKSKSHS
jgi:high-affinity Fe2+/Pb2+ permease